MQSLQVRTGEIRLQVLDDYGETRGVFSFNPNDVKSAQQFLDVQVEFEKKQAEFEKRVEGAETPEEQVVILNEIVDYFKGLVDTCFGEGSSAVLFGDACTLSMFEDFFVGITPYYEEASKQRMAKYSKKKTTTKSTKKTTKK